MLDCACVCKRDYFSIISYFSLAAPSGAFKVHLKVSMEKKKEKKIHIHSFNDDKDSDRISNGFRFIDVSGNSSLWLIIFKCSQDLSGSQFFAYDRIRDQNRLEETWGCF